MKQGGTNDKAFAPTDASQMKGQPQAHKDGTKRHERRPARQEAKGGKLF